MLVTISLSFLAGFFVGNGLPYYVSGSTGGTANPSPFPDSPTVNVLFGCVAVGVGVLLWTLGNGADHELAAGAAGLAGLAAVGLIHSGNWHSDPWGKNAP